MSAIADSNNNTSFWMTKATLDSRVGFTVSSMYGMVLNLTGKNCQNGALLNKVLKAFAQFSQLEDKYREISAGWSIGTKSTNEKRQIDKEYEAAEHDYSKIAQECGISITSMAEYQGPIDEGYYNAGHEPQWIDKAPQHDSSQSDYARLMEPIRAQHAAEQAVKFDTKVLPGFTPDFQSLTISYPKGTTLDETATQKIVGIAQNLECYVNRGFGGTSQSFNERYQEMTKNIKELRDQQISFEIQGQNQTIPSYNF